MTSSTPRDAVRLSSNAITVLEKRYLVKDESGNPAETPEDLFWRVARTIAEPDRRYGASVGAVEEVAHAFYGLMADRRFVPNSPTLMNAGRPLGQLSACLVLPVEDALSNGQNGIYDTLASMALILAACQGSPSASPSAGGGGRAPSGRCARNWGRGWDLMIRNGS